MASSGGARTTSLVVILLTREMAVLYHRQSLRLKQFGRWRRRRTRPLRYRLVVIGLGGRLGRLSQRC